MLNKSRRLDAANLDQVRNAFFLVSSFHISFVLELKLTEVFKSLGRIIFSLIDYDTCHGIQPIQPKPSEWISLTFIAVAKHL